MAADDVLYTVEAREGCLITARLFRLGTVADVDAYSRELGEHVARMPAGRHAALCADHRPIVIYPQPVADRLVELFTQMNTRLKRVAIIAARSNATLVLQLERLVREAAYEERRVFFDAASAEAHLAVALEPRERARAHFFLAAYPPAAP